MNDYISYGLVLLGGACVLCVVVGGMFLMHDVLTDACRDMDRFVRRFEGGRDTQK